MKREIKFRAWDKGDQEMIDWEAILSHPATTSLVLFEQRQYVPMQYTGKKDKNGREIYEGDIICERYEDFLEENGFGESHYEVVFKDGAFGWIGEKTCKHYPFATDPIEDCEVIGNIYENPELVNSEQAMNEAL